MAVPHDGYDAAWISHGPVMDFLPDVILSLAASPWIYLAALALVILDGFFPLFPSEAVIVGLAALCASTGSPNLIPLLLVATLGSATADTATYLLGRMVGRRRLDNLRLRPLSRLLDWAETGLATRPAMLILVARFIPWGRLAVNLMAGALAYPYLRHAPYCLLASTLWAIYNVAMGYLAGRWFMGNPLLGMVIAIILAIGFGLVLDRAIALLRRTKGLSV